MIPDRTSPKLKLWNNCLGLGVECIYGGRGKAVSRHKRVSHSAIQNSNAPGRIFYHSSLLLDCSKTKEDHDDDDDDGS